MARVSVAERRTLIIEAALRTIDRDGLHAASTRAIVAEADMSLASFHYAFDSRGAMLRELIETVVGGEREAALATLNPGTSIRDTLHAGLSAYLELLRREPGREQAMFELFHHALRRPELEGLAATQYEHYHDTAKGLLAAAAESSRMRWRLPLATLARQLIVVTDGLTLAWLADRDDAAARRGIDLAADWLSGFAEPLDPAHPAPAQEETAP